MEKRPVKLGRTDDKMVEILSGLQEGERVVLNSSAVMEEGDENSSSPQPSANKGKEQTADSTHLPAAKL